MAGLVKAKKFDWKDTNMALFGSDTEKNVKKSSAMTEKAWKGAGQKVGIKIWRIVKFKVTDWPVEDYGTFYEGDSYIILRTYKKDPNSEELDHDVHFWIGKYSTQDEYGTAAYKTVELDTFLDDKPIQHREVMDHESERFRSYFKAISKMKGGAESGFRHVEAKKYVPRLLHVFGEKNKVQIKQLKLKKEYLNDDDVFLIDLGLQIYQWNGDNSNKNERFEAGKYVNQLRSDRGGKPRVEVLDNSVTSEIPAELLEIFPDEGQPGTKRPKDRVCTIFNSLRFFFLKKKSSVCIARTAVFV
ncbi:gelsolin-like protein 1 isoform X1 [Oculina patagonica]